MSRPRRDDQRGVSPPEDDPVYRNLMAARQLDALGAELQQAWMASSPVVAQAARPEVLRIHYKPYARARMLVSVGAGDSDPVYLHVQTYPSAALAAKRLETARLKHWAKAVFAIERWNAVVWTLPNGPRMRALRFLFERKRFRRFCRESGLDEAYHAGRVLPELTRYVPRQRALFRHEAPVDTTLPALYIKVYRKHLDASAARNLAALSNAKFEFRTPLVAAHYARRRSIVMTEVPGTQLDASLTASGPEVFASVGEALASLHASDLRSPALWTPDGELTRLELAIQDLESALPVLAGPLRELQARLQARREQLEFDAAAPIHGNLFGDQILIDADGRVGIVDWDDLCQGDPLYDVGRLIAHVLFVSLCDGRPATDVTRCLDELLAAHPSTRRPEPIWPRLCWQVAVALIMRAKISALRPLPDGWVGSTCAAIEEAGRVLDGTSERMPCVRRVASR